MCNLRAVNLQNFLTNHIMTALSDKPYSISNVLQVVNLDNYI